MEKMSEKDAPSALTEEELLSRDKSPQKSKLKKKNRAKASRTGPFQDRSGKGDQSSSSKEEMMETQPFQVNAEPTQGTSMEVIKENKDQRPISMSSIQITEDYIAENSLQVTQAISLKETLGNWAQALSAAKTEKKHIQVKKEIAQLEAPSLRSVMSNKFLKLTVETEEEHRSFSHLLGAQGAEFKTFMLKTDRPIKVVLRGLPSCTPIEEIKEELIKKGFTVVSITQQSKFQTKSMMPLFYAQIANGPLLETVYTLTEMFGTKISVERYRGRKGPSQC
ncbi:hypothetical protein HNY73_010641 [Argiope bruennichi]|uniref:Pre-C2HC domain-containing protein n=1 Tax=Argiope bruennichi TaxID=94029 RepID=A0A8T0F436_ARGBR|nr:hypothetical protein HNY73_010641 [Argiope bruennichi]